MTSINMSTIFYCHKLGQSVDVDSMNLIKHCV